MVETNSINLLEKIKAQKENELIVFTTFVFDPLFFDSYLLKTIKDKNPKATILVLIDSKTYYQNIKEFTEETGNSYALIPISGNLFHSKIFLFLSEKQNQVFLGSHNLTHAGLTHNLELSFESNSDNVIHDCIRYIHTLLEVNLAPENPYLKKINTFYDIDIKNSVLIDNLEKPILEQTINKIIENKKSISEIIVFAPYYSHVDRILDKINTKLNPNLIKLCIQKNNHNLDVKNLDRFNNLKYFEINPINQNRRMHSKFIVFKTQETDYILIGSPNFTKRALLDTKNDGNFESALLINKNFSEFISNNLEIKSLNQDKIKISQREINDEESIQIKNSMISFAYVNENNQLVIEYDSKIKKEIQVELLDSKSNIIESFAEILNIGKHILIIKHKSEFLKSVKFTFENQDLSNIIRICNPSKQKTQRKYDFSDDETIRNSIEQNLEIEEIIQQCNALFAYGIEDNFADNPGVKGEKITYSDSEPVAGRRHSKILKKPIISIKINKSSNSKKSNGSSKNSTKSKEKTKQEIIHNYIEGIINKFEEFVLIDNKHTTYLMYLNYSLKLLEKLLEKLEIDNQLGIKAVRIITGFDKMIRTGKNFKSIENGKKIEILKIILELVLIANQNLTQRHKFDDNVRIGFETLVLDDLKNEIPFKNLVKKINELELIGYISISDKHKEILKELYQQILLDIPLNQKNVILTKITEKLIQEQNSESFSELLKSIKFFIQIDKTLLRNFEKNISSIDNENIQNTITRIINEIK